MMNRYDVLIVGGGPAGIFTALELSNLHPELHIALLEEGASIRRRSCPIVEGAVSHCIHCPTCAIMRGFGGAGAYSDGKFNFTTQFGGWMNEYLEEQEVLDLIAYVDKINQDFGAPAEFYSTATEEAARIRQRALGADIHLLDARCKHLGTEKNLQILTAQADALEQKIDLLCRKEVTEIHNLDGAYRLSCKDGSEYEARWLVAAPGRAGAEWFSEQCHKLGLRLLNNQVDLGVRVELPALVFKDVTDVLYEAKLKYRTKQYGDIVRTFCMNPYGYVVTENTDGIITVNGHSYADPDLRSQNTNFALLVSNKFTEPFSEPYRYGKHIASLSNMLGGGIIVQRFGDLIEGRRTNEHRLKNSFTRPTLQATPGDLSLVLPKRHVDNIIEMIQALDQIVPGTANQDTLLYGVEVKFYSARLELDRNFETSLDGFYAIGDGAGLTRGLSQAGASGVLVARAIARRLEAEA